MGVKVDFFKGEAPKYLARHLPSGYARSVSNLKLSDGKFRPWYGQLFSANPTKSGEIKSIYPMRDPGTDALYWLHWTQDVSIVPAPIAGDTTQRVYFTGDGAPKASNYSMATTSPPAGATGYPYNTYRLGTPRPASAPGILSVTGAGSGTALDRTYAVTFVHIWADGKTDEGMPSDASAIATVQLGQTVNLNNLPRYVNAVGITRAGSTATATSARPHGFATGDVVTHSGAAQAEYNIAAAVIVTGASTYNYQISGAPVTATGSPIAVGHNNITKKWLWRTVSGNSGAFYRFVTELNESDTTYADAATDATISLNRAMVSTLWDMPPADLKFLTEINGDTMVGITGNQVCFCEPNYPHAWPQAYRFTIPYEAVGLATLGKSVIVGAKGNPYIFTGDHPSAMSRRRLRSIQQPCVSGRSMIGLGWGVVYAGRDRPVVVGEGGNEISKIDYYERDSWRLENPDTMRSFVYGDRYIGTFPTGVDANSKIIGQSIVISNEDNVGGIARFGVYASAAHYDVKRGELYIYSHVGGQIVQWDADRSSRMTGQWRSGEFVFSKPENMGALKIDADFGATVEEATASASVRAVAMAANAALFTANTVHDTPAMQMVTEFGVTLGNSVPVPDIVPRWTLSMAYYAAGKLRFQRSLNNTKAVKLPAGYKTDTGEIEIIGTATVHRVLVAETMTALERA